jgi:hypothetical protein
MKSNLRRSCIVIAAISIILILGPMTESPSRVYAQDSHPRIIPPNARAFGMTYGEWSAKWWQWAFSLPIDQNPFFDEGGACAHGANGQPEPGPVWFLTGVINVSGTAVRNCVVPMGKALFFPLINVECSTLEADPFHGNNEAELRACASRFHFGDVFAEIDGMAVENLARYLKQSPIFTFTVPPNNVLGVTAGTGQSVSDGYYLMLAPLSVGKHVIHFGGTFTDFAFTLDITYNISVHGRRHEAQSGGERAFSLPEDQTCDRCPKSKGPSVNN